MSQELIYTCLYAALGLTDSILQIWITLTFAVIVSTYVAASQAFYFKNLLVRKGFTPWPVPNWVSILIGGGTTLLLVSGTFGTLWFVRSTWKKIEQAASD